MNHPRAVEEIRQILLRQLGSPKAEKTSKKTRQQASQSSFVEGNLTTDFTDYTD